MQARLAQLKRLREKGLGELGHRGRQEFGKLAERLLGLSVGEMSDGGFLRHIKRGHRGVSPEDTADRLVKRIQLSVNSSQHMGGHSFFPSLGQRREMVATMERRFGRERQELIERANRAIEGRFDLLGFTDLSFGSPPDWLLEPLSGKRIPLDHWSGIDYLDPSVAGDKKVTWELNRHQHFATFGQAYWLTGDEKYAEAFVSQATSWMDANPTNRGINWVSSLELAFRSIAWLWALHLFAGSPRISPRFALRLLKHLIAHGLHIQSYLSRYFSPNTHLTGEALGLFYLGTALGELGCAETWRRLGLDILLGELPRQVRADGVYFEQATYYHRYSADFYTHLLVLARASEVNLPIGVEETLVRMLTHLMWITRPDGTSPLIGDDDGGRLIVLGARRPDDFRDTLATGAALCARKEWKHAAGDAAVETLWLLGPEALACYDAMQSEAPLMTSRAFQTSGYTVLRDGWSTNSTFVLMDCGPHGSLSCGHAHADALSIEFAALGTAWLVDPGTFTYTADTGLRNWFRSTEAHNTITVDGKSQSVPAGPFSWKHVAQASLDDLFLGDGFDYIEGSHDGYQRLTDPVRHTRAVLCPKAGDGASGSLPSYLIVRDTLAAIGRHRYAIRYHLAPECSAFSSGNRVIVTGPGGSRLNISVHGSSTPQARITRDWVSRAYGRREPALVAVFDVIGEGPQQFTTFIAPTNEHQSVRIERLPMIDPSAQGFQVISGTTRDVLLMSDGTELNKLGALAADGAVAWARFEEDVFARAILIRGQRLTADGGFAFRSDGPINHFAIRRTEGGFEGSVNGGDRFHLGFGEHTHKVVINGTSFVMDSVSQLLPGTARDESGSMPANEAIN